MGNTCDCSALHIFVNMQVRKKRFVHVCRDHQSRFEISRNPLLLDIFTDY